VIEFWHFLWGGLVMGGIATAYPALTGRYLGVSGIYTSLFERRKHELVIDDELEAALLAATRAEFGADAVPEALPTWRDHLARLHASMDAVRPLFLVGLVIGAALAALLGDDLEPRASLGKSFDERYGDVGALPLLVLLVGGLCIGIGTRVGSGCTSGHGISGVARGEKGSLLTTVVFWSTAVLLSWLLLLLGVG
jgi:uncharacterized membrane protein YedE/YeeE